MRKNDALIYGLAIMFGMSAGILEITVGDLLASALFVSVCTLVLGFLRPERPWRWIIIVGAFVPLARIGAFFLLAQKSDRAQIWESGLGFLTGMAGAYCGSFARRAVHELFPGGRPKL